MTSANAPAEGNPLPLFIELFYYRLLNDDCPGDQRTLSTRVSLDHVCRVQVCMKLLLKHGTSLDSVGPEKSEL